MADAGAEEAKALRGVGRVAIAGQGFCTGTRISPILVLRAAHCPCDARSLEPLPLRALRFPTARGRRPRDEERRIARAAATTAFRFDGRPRAVTADLALLELARPVRPSYCGAPRRRAELSREVFGATGDLLNSGRDLSR